ncbi:MAG: hypothetical protein LBC18_09135 [Opitutaceae bacterium]|jgi:hypothetical protein|nr:hypothetical protein [Opitutaceae bacterium]
MVFTAAGFIAMGFIATSATSSGAPDATPFTVSNTGGNQYRLVTTTTIPVPQPGEGNEPAQPPKFLFRAAGPGAIRTTIGTITTPVTIILGVIAVDNPDPPANIGVDEESDFDLRIRRARTLSLPAVGTVDGILSSILDVPGVTEAIVYENITNQTDADGIPGHSIWCIVEGGKDKDVAQAIYLTDVTRKRRQRLTFSAPEGRHRPIENCDKPQNQCKHALAPFACLGLSKESGFSHSL